MPDADIVTGLSDPDTHVRPAHMDRALFIPVFFNAPLGGLQSHVKAQVMGARRYDWTVTVMCKPGAFADELVELGVTVIETDFSDLGQSVQQAIKAGPFSLVHAHPFASRKVGIEVARHFQVPFFVSMHGGYTDGMDAWAEDVHTVICVSDAIRDYLIGEIRMDPGKVNVIPNAVDDGCYVAPPRDPQRSRGGSSPKIAIVSRFDADKTFIVDAVVECLTEASRSAVHTLDWQIAGSGSEIGKISEAAQQLQSVHGADSVTMLGWLGDRQLAELYACADLTIGSGRCALDAMACGSPSIALGSKGYVGLLSGENLRRGIYSNFGGIDKARPDYVPGQLYRDLDAVIYEEDLLARVSREGRAVCDALYRQESADARLAAFYELALGGSPVQQVAFPKSAAGGGDGRVELEWHARGDDGTLNWHLDSRGCLFGAADIPQGASIYLTSGPQPFSRSNTQLDYPVQDGDPRVVSVPVLALEASLGLMLFIAEYEAGKRIRQKQYRLQPGQNEFHFRPEPRSETVRVFIRFAGTGAFRLGEVQLKRQPIVPAEAGERHGYRGENLIFVLGAPRSGTTWLLGVLGSHPDVHQVTEADLMLPSGGRPSLETNVFNPNRALTDNQIRWMFRALSERHSTPMVEKTPLHLLHADRIKRVFPGCRLVLIARDGRDVVSSMLQVGRDPDAWWRSAPKHLNDAIKLWTRYAEAALECIETLDPIVVRYEEIVDDPRAVFSRLFADLDLDTACVSQCIEQTEGGRHIPIQGVYRSGTKNNWIDDLSAQEVAELTESIGPLLQRLGYS